MQTLDHPTDDQLDRLYKKHSVDFWYFTTIRPDPDAAAIARQHRDALLDEIAQRNIADKGW